MTDTTEYTLALRDLVAWAERQGCKHSLREAWGVIGQTICTSCGQVWSDQDGGFKPDPVAPEILRARDALEPVDPDAQAREIWESVLSRHPHWKSWDSASHGTREAIRAIAAWHRGKMAAEWDAAIEAALLSIKTEGVLRAIHAVANLTRVPAP